MAEGSNCANSSATRTFAVPSGVSETLPDEVKGSAVVTTADTPTIPMLRANAIGIPYILSSVSFTILAPPFSAI
jgi:hypothetical protein